MAVFVSLSYVINHHCPNSYGTVTLFQLSLLCGILCVISADNKIYGGVQLHRQCENLKKRVLIHVVSQIYAK